MRFTETVEWTYLCCVGRILILGAPKSPTQSSPHPLIHPAVTPTPLLYPPHGTLTPLNVLPNLESRSHSCLLPKSSTRLVFESNLLDVSRMFFNSALIFINLLMLRSYFISSIKSLFCFTACSFVLQLVQNFA